MDATTRINQAKIAIMRHSVFAAFSGVLACGKLELDSSVPTMCTNGWDIRANPEFVNSLSATELRFVLLHEALHKAYKHMYVWRELRKQNSRRTNVAADHFVNLALVDTDKNKKFITIPSIGIQPNLRYRGWSVKQIYDDLGDSDDDSEGFDQHDWTEQSGQEAHAEEIDRALRQGEQLARQIRQLRDGAENTPGIIADLLAPRVDWRQVLREFVTETCSGRDETTWRKPNRRFLWDNVYMPTTQATTIGDLVVVLDTSRSCFDSTILTRFVSELAGVIESVTPARTWVLYVDTVVSAAQMFEDGQFAVTALTPSGGGGTYMPAAFNYCKEQNISPQAMIILTDGETPFGSPPGYPVLWAITGKNGAPWGTTIHVEES